MEEQDITGAFNNYIEPSSIPFRYGAPGWWVLAALILLAVISISFLWIRSQKRNKYRKYAVQYLDRIIQQGNTGTGLNGQVYEAAILMKQVAMKRYGRNPVAGLSGEAWMNWMNGQIKKSGVPRFDQSDVALVSKGIYGNGLFSAEEVGPFFEKAKAWIRYHHAV